MGFIICNKDGEKVRYANSKKEADLMLKFVKGGRIVNLKQTKAPNASKKRFIINDLRYRKYVSIN
ncbi:MAG: hypothetical protein II453_13975 [Alphaproteobacteria bacterium]|nr:hypothetical protein [Alphaproteobacteria bacterium]